MESSFGEEAGDFSTPRLGGALNEALCRAKATGATGVVHGLSGVDAPGRGDAPSGVDTPGEAEGVAVFFFIERSITAD